MKKVLITGATGFAGMHLIDHLSKDSEIEIFGTSLTTSGKNEKGTATIEKIDLTDYQQVLELIEKIKPDQIYHLAALTAPGKSFDKSTEVVLANIEVEMNLLNALKEKELKSVRVLIVSSAEVYGLVEKEDLPVDEQTKLNPANPYAVSKIAQDFLGLQYFFSEKMDIVRVRPFNHTGPGQNDSFVIPSFAHQIAEIEKGEKEPVLRVGNLDAKRDISDVRDIVRGYVLLMEKGKGGEVYNIGSGKSFKIGELLDILLALSDKKIAVEKDQSKIRPIDVVDTYSDNSKIKKLTGWNPEIPIEKTLKETLDYWRALL